MISGMPQAAMAEAFLKGGGGGGKTNDQIFFTYLQPGPAVAER